MAIDLTPADPTVVLELLEAFRRSKIMFAGVSLGHLRRTGPSTRNRYRSGCQTGLRSRLAAPSAGVTRGPKTPGT